LTPLILNVSGEFTNNPLLVLHSITPYPYILKLLQTRIPCALTNETPVVLIPTPFTVAIITVPYKVPIFGSIFKN